MSASRVSRICSSLDESVADLRERDLTDVVYPYIRLDATYIKRGGAGHVQSTAPFTAIGAGTAGKGAFWGWRSFTLSPCAREVDSVICVTGDPHEGSSAIQEVFPGAARRHCIAPTSSSGAVTASHRCFSAEGRPSG